MDFSLGLPDATRVEPDQRRKAISSICSDRVKLVSASQVIDGLGLNVK